MKPIHVILIFLIALFSAKSSIAQSGRIIFEQKTQMNIDVQGDDAEAIQNLPKEHVSKKELLFNTESSIFQNIVEEKNDEIEGGDDHHKMMIKIDEPDNKVYCDLKEKKRVEQREFMSRKFLMEIPFNASVWKMTGNHKMILDHNCEEAILQDSVRKITAWFTSEIPLPTGPQGVCNLPGMVLMADFNDGETTLTAKNIELKPIGPELIVKPKEGKKVTREEFNKMVMEKNKEMEEENGGNGNVIIRIKK